MSTIIVILISVIVSLLITRWLSHSDSPIRILDHPNERSLHNIPTPRTGGLAICTALVMAWLVSLIFSKVETIPWQMPSGAAIVAGISILDDRYRLSQVVRILVQVCATFLLIRGGFIVQGDLLPGLSLTPVVLTTIITVFMTLWLINLYNFMDGMDGFAGGMAVIGFGTLALLGWCQDDYLFSRAALVVSMAAAGFLWFNFPPARIFMGDSGSTTLGFLVAGFGIWGSRKGIAPIWFTLVVFSPFVVDATVTLIRRALHGEPIWRAHCSHYYQRLVRLGWGHRRTVLVEYLAMLICSGSAFIMIRLDTSMQWMVLAILASGYLAAALAVHRMEQKS